MLLSTTVFSPLPLGQVRPLGWLRDQLLIQADGLTGSLDEFWPSVSRSRWIGGDQEGWERAPYWLDGLIPLAALLEEERLLEKARRWIEYILEHQQEDGWFGPREDPHQGVGEVTLDPWPQFILFKALTQWQEASGDPRIIPALLKAAHRIGQLLEEKPLRSWARMRWADLVVSLHWLFERTGEAWLLEVAALAQAQGYNWQEHFDRFSWRERTDPGYLGTLSEEDCLPLHGVNNAMGVKAGAVWSRQSGSFGDALSSLRAVEMLEEFHGQVTGMFSGDEHLAGRDPIQGTETCTVVEYMFTLEQMLAITGKPELGDRLERIAFNALPASMTRDMRGRQYDQQPNQVLCDVQRRQWVSNGKYSNLFSLEGNFGCCTANLHQGWPKFTASLWLGYRESEEASESRGLVAAVYAPSVVSFELNGAAGRIVEETDYPFREEVRFTLHLEASVEFPLLLRIPVWADGATVTINNEPPETVAADSFHRLRRVWNSGDRVTLHLPMPLRLERGFAGSVAVLRGPLVLALRIGEEFRQVGGALPYADWAVHPTTAWNYALVSGAEIEGAEVSEAPISRVPFATDHPPVVVRVPARRLPGWQLSDGSAVFPEAVASSGTEPLETVELIPYGSTHLRISNFPAG